MKITVLMDNNTLIDKYFLAEPAVSYLIEESGVKILFDLGYSDAFIQNGQKMGEDLLDINYIVISHGHNDHTRGLQPLLEHLLDQPEQGFLSPKIIAHPTVFEHKEYEGESIGADIDMAAVKTACQLNLQKNPFWITPSLVFLGEIERNNDFENKSPLGKHGDDRADDYLMDDSALVYKSKDGLVIITGCSHSGICNIIEYGKKICGEERIVDIIGGFHLLQPDERQDQGTRDYFQRAKIAQMHPCHCTSLQYKIILSHYSNIGEIGVSKVLEYN
ncbi:MBL fold metallo-hydrolase [Desulfotalea psychrophila]|uniref:Metallo-beta-lactamase domain-containing protein n=1 Tax=Desulfotalea psychrophila (strain LSv54 / DSM 12343) TaxID=177439 RepID=Q6APN4_DESPS|nr:MBL fold metallo-hydrolase [Desulfotalea psychrophila]CAG35690.1 hypothetical protein DP0961 [Desulfotalea psychrophila LSv54]